MSDSFRFRPGTLDEEIFKLVCVNNEYKLPEKFSPNDIIIDIGVHIGSFCYAALLRGANHVYGYEADLANYELAMENLRPFGERVHLYHKAVWRSDLKNVKLFHTGYFSSPDSTVNTGGGNVMWATEGVEVEAVAFDDVIQQVSGQGKKRIRLVKIDAEGSEFPILLTAKNLQLIDNICGEYHEIMGEYDKNSMPVSARISGYERFTIVDLADFLKQSNFEVASSRNGNTNFGYFFATYRGQKRRYFPDIRNWFHKVKQES